MKKSIFFVIVFLCNCSLFEKPGACIVESTYSYGDGDSILCNRTNIYTNCYDVDNETLCEDGYSDNYTITNSDCENSYHTSIIQGFYEEKDCIEVCIEGECEISSREILGSSGNY